MSAPLVEVVLADGRAAWRAGEVLAGTATITSTDGSKIGEVELSVMWVAEGKGNADTGVVWFESFPKTEERERVLPLRARLPLLPRTYHGDLVKIGWLVRVRCLGRGGDDTVVDTPFLVQ